MAREGLSPYADWTSINPTQALWYVHVTAAALLANTGIAAPLLAANVAADTISPRAAANRRLGANARPNSTTTLATEVFGYAVQIAVPDFTHNYQPGKADGWDGTSGTAYDDDAAPDAKTALLVENVIASIDDVAITPTAYDASCKFRGYGEPLSGQETQDTPVCGAGFNAATAFPDMRIALPSFALGGGHLIRIQTLVELPGTVGAGDLIDFQSVIVIPAGPGAVSWEVIKYRWVTAPYFQFPNTSVQLIDDPNGFDERQPRVDEAPYEP